MLNKIRFLSLTAILLAGFGLSACNTLNGAGQDVENAGESIQDAAR
ncbi:MAG: entericidin A/B family lipoprotein [Alphaproteobacteria bacterium]|nr:entericidin A/B family lipoprotein [Alphaproteobacteria bacterium]